MTREEVAQKIKWDWIIRAIGVINPVFMVPQLVKIWTTGDATSISISAVTLLIVIQSGFSLHGFFLRDKTLMISNCVAAIVTATTTASALYFGA